RLFTHSGTTKTFCLVPHVVSEYVLLAVDSARVKASFVILHAATGGIECPSSLTAPFFRFCSAFSRRRRCGRRSRRMSSFRQTVRLPARASHRHRSPRA